MRNETTSERCEVVRIDCEHGKVSCDKPKVQLYWETGPDTIEWVVGKAPRGATAEIVWEGESPLREVKAKGERIKGSGNRKKKGEFKYTIRFTNPAEKKVWELDPIVANNPRPPLPHDDS